MRAIEPRIEPRATRARRCGGGRLAIAGAVLIAAAGAAGAFTREQVDFGAWVFRRQCARCHGADGGGADNAWRGLRAPELIGPGALPRTPRPYQQIRRREFTTVADVYWFVSASMPADQPASLEAEEYWDAIAWILRSNGVAPDGKPLGDASADVPLPGAKAGP
jgi:polar amino acid transport system substrate-binding protein